MKVVTVILNWNSWRDTVECLRSLEKLDYPHKLLVIDNASTNDSAIRIRETCPQVELIALSENLGFGGGCNLGIRRAMALDAGCIWLLNSDAIVETSSLRAMVETMESDDGIGAVGSVLYEMNDPDRVQVWGGFRVRMVLGGVKRYKTRTPIDRLEYISGASCLLRADAVRSVGYFDEGFFMYWEDADLGYRLRRAGWKLAVAERSRVWHKGCASMGRRSTAHDRWNNFSATRFFRRYSKAPVIPLIVGGGYRIARRLALGDFKRVAAVIRGTMEGVSRRRNCAS